MMTLMPRRAFPFLSLLFLGGLWIAPALAAASSSMGVRLGAHPSFDRIVFDAPRGATYVLTREGGRVRLRFSMPARASLPRETLARIGGLAVVSDESGQGPFEVSFWVAPSATLKDFMSGASVVVDVSGPPAPESEPAAPPSAEKAPAGLEGQGEGAGEAAQKQEDSPPAAPEALKEEAAPFNPDAIASSPALSPVMTAPEAASSVSGEKDEQVVAEQEWAPSSVPVLDVKTAAALRALAETKPSVPLAVFDPGLEVGAAIFARAGFINVFFDRTLAEGALKTQVHASAAPQPMKTSRQTAFRIAIPETLDVRATRRGTAWELYLVHNTAPAALTTEFLPQPNFVLGARLLLPTASPPEVVAMRDPVVGDSLLVVPLRETGAFTVKRRFADFVVLPAAQGLVLRPLRESVAVRTTPDGLELTAEGGLNLSPLQDMGRGLKGWKQGARAERPLFDLVRWRGKEGETFDQTRQNLMKAIVEVSEEERVLARLDLARLYFAYGLGREATSVLEIVSSILPEIERYPEFLALRGAARLIAGRPGEGLADLEGEVLKDRGDVAVWRAYGHGLSRDWGDSHALFALAKDGVEGYPEPLFSSLVLMAVEAALAMDADKEASDWLEKLEAKKEQTPALKAALSYLRGVLYSKAGQAQTAETFWRRAARGRDRVYKIRAELALIDLGVATKSLTSAQAVDRLEGLRFAWRGDDLEFDILKRLGGYALDARDFARGFKVLTQATRLFPGSPQALALQADMSKTFQDLYLTALGEDLSPIEALSLYADYKNLIPAGAEGNAVRLNLAERLVAVDLLEQAGKLLEDMAKNSAKPEEKIAILTRLAGVRLLDHKAQEALVLLEQSEAAAAALSQTVKDERYLLRARALSELGRYQDALAALPAGQEKATLLLRADMALRAKQWGDAARALLALLAAVPAGKPLGEEEAQWLVHAALALAQGGDRASMDKLAADYGVAMDKTAQASVFRVLTRPESMADMKDLQAAQRRLAEVDMFRGILDSYRKEKKN